MLTFVTQNFKFILLVIAWITAFILNLWIGVAVILLSVIILYYQTRLPELLTGFIFLLIFSDSAIQLLDFATDARAFYVVFLGFVYFKHRKALPFQKQLLPFFVPFFIITAFFTLINKDPYFGLSMQKLLSYFLLLASVPALVHYATVNDQKRFFHFLVYSGALVLAVGIVLMFLIPEVGANFGGRLNGIFRNPNGVGMFASLFGIICFFIFSHFKKYFSPNSIILVSAIVILSLFLCASRNGLATLAIFIGLSIISRFRKFGGLAIGVAMIVIVATSYQGIIDLVENSEYQDYLRVQTLEIGSGRFFAWQAAWKEIDDFFFWTGNGFAYAEESGWMEKYHDEIPELIYHQGNIHNSFLTLWMNTGLIGLALFVIPLLIIFVKAYRKTYYAVPVLISTLFLGFFESWMVASLNPFTILFWIIITLMLIYDIDDVQKAYIVENRKQLAIHSVGLHYLCQSLIAKNKNPV